MIVMKIGGSSLRSEEPPIFITIMIKPDR